MRCSVFPRSSGSIAQNGRMGSGSTSSSVGTILKSLTGFWLIPTRAGTDAQSCGQSV